MLRKANISLTSLERRKNYFINKFRTTDLIKIQTSDIYVVK